MAHFLKDKKLSEIKPKYIFIQWKYRFKLKGRYASPELVWPHSAAKRTDAEMIKKSRGKIALLRALWNFIPPVLIEVLVLCKTVLKKENQSLEKKVLVNNFRFSVLNSVPRVKNVIVKMLFRQMFLLPASLEFAEYKRIQFSPPSKLDYAFKPRINGRLIHT